MNLSYFRPASFGGFTYSIDNLILKGSFHPEVIFDQIFRGSPWTIPFLNGFSMLLHELDSDLIAHHFDSDRFMAYRDMWQIELANGGVVRCMFRFNSYHSEDSTRWKIIFNPNKCLPCPALERIIRFCVDNSSLPYVGGFDLAVDIPRQRSDFLLIKDSRKYQLIMNSMEDRTEYLGQRGHMGFVKLYNKQIESKLPFPLTRLEISAVMDSREDVFSFSAFMAAVPELYCLDGGQQVMDDLALNGTDRALLEYAIISPTMLCMLPQIKRAKIRGLLADRFRRITLDQSTVFDLYKWISEVI